LIIGSNAQGKTSLLEAVYYLATFVTFQGSADRQLINFLAAREPLAVARIVGEYTDEDESHRLEVRIIQEPNGVNGNTRVRKEVLWDGAKQKLSGAVGRFNAVMFLPHMMAVIDGAPEERRRYLNLALAQVFPAYADALANYHRSLTQRNALLKTLAERGGDQSQVDYWDEQLAASGALIIQSRIKAILELERQAARIQRDLTRGEEILRFCYEPSYDPLPAPRNQFSLPLDTTIDRSKLTYDQIRQGFRERLAQNRTEEISRGMTLIGPHRDEVRFLSNGVDLGTYGSRGQVRTVMLALKLAEVEWMREKTGRWPVLLLDEVLAELDLQRRADLLSRLSASEQVLLTTTDLDLFSPEFVQSGTVWKLQGGTLAKEGQAEEKEEHEG
jgi:DNA replication and repair protein RecF